MNPIVKFREEETAQILELLNSVTLGTNGAQYRHLDTNERISELDQPLFLSLERQNKVFANITFCRRNDDWYIRYFAFSNALQSSGKKKSNATKQNILRRELNDFFNSVLTNDGAYGKVQSFYAYIDPKNEKSLWMSENFGFHTVGKVATQTFSRIKPKPSVRVQKSMHWEDVRELIDENYSRHSNFYTVQTEKPPYYILRNTVGKTIACAKISHSTWEIKRLPGLFGGILTRVIPFIPGLRSLIKPEKHAFVVPEAVVVLDNDPALLEELFSAILFEEKRKLLLWWIDQKDPLYQKLRLSVKWGILHKMLGASEVNIVQKRASVSASNQLTDHPFYISGFDFI